MTLRSGPLLKAAADRCSQVLHQDVQVSRILRERPKAIAPIERRRFVVLGMDQHGPPTDVGGSRRTPSKCILEEITTKPRSLHGAIQAETGHENHRYRPFTRVSGPQSPGHQVRLNRVRGERVETYDPLSCLQDIGNRRSGALIRQRKLLQPCVKGKHTTVERVEIVLTSYPANGLEIVQACGI